MSQEENKRLPVGSTQSKANHGISLSSASKLSNLVVLREVRPENQEESVRLTIESCGDLRPEEQIAPWW